VGERATRDVEGGDRGTLDSSSTGVGDQSELLRDEGGGSWSEEGVLCSAVFVVGGRGALTSRSGLARLVESEKNCRRGEGESASCNRLGQARATKATSSSAVADL
jgi:hypothetical protein